MQQAYARPCIPRSSAAPHILQLATLLNHSRNELYNSQTYDDKPVDLIPMFLSQLLTSASANPSNFVTFFMSTPQMCTIQVQNLETNETDVRCSLSSQNCSGVKNQTQVREADCANHDSLHARAKKCFVCISSSILGTACGDLPGARDIPCWSGSCAFFISRGIALP